MRIMSEPEVADRRRSHFDFHSISREHGSSQQPLTAGQIEVVCRRAFGPDARVTSAVELALGSYNNTYRVTLAEQDQPVILRVAPEDDRPVESERHFMRNEYETLPWLTVIAPLLPRVIAADWTHEVIDRDWMILTLLDGVPAPEGLAAYPRPSWGPYFRQLGGIAKAVHSVRGPHFGPITGPGYTTWSEALIASLQTITEDVKNLGLAAEDLHQITEQAARHRAVLDEIPEPHLLPGDLWTANLMLAENTSEPTICGVLDLDRAIWGDPAADWTIYVAMARPGTEREAFWDPDGYGSPPESTPAAVWRSRIYEARHLGGIRLESVRVGNTDGVRQTYEALAALLTTLD
jgi:aminoglycoside phosphotransferase (APT) family kinase protein